MSNYILDLMREGDIKHDPWGTAMSWGFACAETLTVLGEDIPDLDYRPSPFVQIETEHTYLPESYEDSEVWEYLTNGVVEREAAISEVQQACKILDRYLDWCKASGRDY